MNENEEIKTEQTQENGNRKDAKAKGMSLKSILGGDILANDFFRRQTKLLVLIMLAQPGDVILVAGKGHENYQEIKGVKHHFDDKEVLREVFGN